MSHAAFSGWAAIRTGVYFPALIVAFATTPSSCSSCFQATISRGEFPWDFSDFEAFEGAQDGGNALELNLVERIAAPDDAKRLHDFGREEGSSLARARELVDGAIRDAEAELQAKWPQGRLALRMVGLSLVAPLYDAARPGIVDDVDDSEQRYDRGYLAEFVEQLRETYPDRAAALPDVEKLKANAKKADEAQEPGIASIDVVSHFRMAYTDQRPDGDFKTKKELELALLRTDPMKATLRLVYEIVAPKGQVKETVSDPVLAAEVVALEFEYDGELWKAVPKALSDAEADEPKADGR